jgi:hypothetical protein
MNESNCIARFDSLPVAIYSGRDGKTATGQVDASEATNHVSVGYSTFKGNANSSDCNGTPDILVSANVEHVMVNNNQIKNSAITNGFANQGAITVRGEDDNNPYARARKVLVTTNDVADVAGFGIYVQSANNVLIERNSIRRTTYGVQISTEDDDGAAPAEAHAGYVWMRNNLVENPTLWAIDVGDQTPFNDSVHDVHITNNTVLSTRDTPPDNLLRFEVLLRNGLLGDSRYANNIVSMQWSSSTCTPLGGNACDYLLAHGESTMDADIDYNLWYVSGYPPPTSFANAKLWVGGSTGRVFGLYQDEGHDWDGMTADPLISNYHVQYASPARSSGVAITPTWVTTNGANFGDYAGLAFPERDFYGTVRVHPYDRGMEEF